MRDVEEDTVSFDEWYEDHGDGTGYEEAKAAWGHQQCEIGRLKAEIEVLENYVEILDSRLA